MIAPDGIEADQSVGGPTTMRVFRSTAAAEISTAVPTAIWLCGPVPAGLPVVLGLAPLKSPAARVTVSDSSGMFGKKLPSESNW